MSFFSRTKERDSAPPVAVVEDNQTIEKVIANLGALVPQLSHGANRLQQEIAAKRDQLSRASTELRKMKESSVHAERFGVDVKEKMRAQQETVGRLQSDLKELENELKDLRVRGPKEFASAKETLAKVQEEQKQVIIDALWAAAVAVRRAEELGRAYEDAGGRYEPVARNFRLAALNSALPPPPPTNSGGTATGHSRYALKMREYRSKNQPAGESPHRRWPTGNNVECFEVLLRNWKK